MKCTTQTILDAPLGMVITHLVRVAAMHFKDGGDAVTRYTTVCIDCGARRVWVHDAPSVAVGEVVAMREWKQRHEDG